MASRAQDVQRLAADLASALESASTHEHRLVLADALALAAMNLRSMIAKEKPARRYVVNGEEPIDEATLIEHNQHDPEVLLAVRRLQVGETWGGGSGGDVKRIA